MLRKEFRIVLPFSCDEYRRGQLYCVAQSSKQETKGDSGVEVLKNEPYDATSDPTSAATGTAIGQYTSKIYHLGSRLPAWLSSLAPSSALKLEEQAWNAFPYCKTELTIPLMGDRFVFRIESKYFDNDLGTQDNVFDLSPSELAAREVSTPDFTDSSLIAPEDNKEETDPTKFQSAKTGRGPLVQGQWQASTTPLMCAYKLVTVEFRWWGLQTRVQTFIMSLMTAMLIKFHRQMFCWLDDWVDLTMEDVRAIEDQIAQELKQKIQAQIKSEPSTPTSTPNLPPVTSASAPQLSSDGAPATPSTPSKGWGWW